MWMTQTPPTALASAFRPILTAVIEGQQGSSAPASESLLPLLLSSLPSTEFPVLSSPQYRPTLRLFLGQGLARCSHSNRY
ncbi:uncharacterized protein BDR25DRAFT_46918 [Lindgomyces ingoldianus]|uniref:Uncharacterized protein n=1 Tax=Lindgomyces ingoldianus TaxID=673940 RepID=A0ACB6QRR2_9PLEO|nr:uncharacterized protein BDR25DRAFT_46918 [Lindgomyces ingoldianus]KAF2469664.1 hypothetical protein BDR25DRAFT_46918 [Lindgomyces ingoldianus]